MKDEEIEELKEIVIQKYKEAMSNSTGWEITAEDMNIDIDIIGNSVRIVYELLKENAKERKKIKDKNWRGEKGEYYDYGFENGKQAERKRISGLIDMELVMYEDLETKNIDNPEVNKAVICILKKLKREVENENQKS